jgi:pilus assembly protein Flp/PilA
MKALWCRIKRRLTQDAGASLVEYALLLALIAVVCITAVTFFGQATSDSFSTSSSSIFLGN